jgi:hypothetical protein
VDCADVDCANNPNCYGSGSDWGYGSGEGNNTGNNDEPKGDGLSGEARNLTCYVGASVKADGTGTPCTKSYNRAEPDETDKPCLSGNKCLTGNFAHGWSTAFGCFRNDASIAETKAAIEAACKADTECAKYNDGGVPKDGWTVCKTDECNECKSPSQWDSLGKEGTGDAIAPLMLMGPGMVLFASVIVFMW